MHLSDIGTIADQCWRAIPDHFPYVTLDSYVIMPDHMHGIITIGDDMPCVAVIPRGSVETCDSHVSTDTGRRIPRPPPGSLGSIINQFKSACTKKIWKSGKTDFQWQPRFHESVIRDDRALDQIRQYIINNPAAWHNDRLYK